MKPRLGMRLAAKSSLPPFFVIAWNTGELMEPKNGFTVLSEAEAAANELAHNAHKSIDGMYYIPRAYVVDSRGETVYVPVFLTGKEPPENDILYHEEETECRMVPL